MESAAEQIKQLNRYVAMKIEGLRQRCTEQDRRSGSS